MIMTFVTIEYGKIEINTDTRVVYSFKNDHEYALQADNSWTDLDGARWDVINDPYKKTGIPSDYDSEAYRHSDLLTIAGARMPLPALASGRNVLIVR